MDDDGPLRVAVTALGCKVNYAEMADLAGRLAAAGCEVVPDSDSADVRILNSCTVTLQADATTRQRLRTLRRDDPGAHLVLTGCSVDGNPALYQRRDERGRPVPPPGVDAVFSNAEKDSVAEHVLRMAAARGAPMAPPRPAPLRSRAFIKVQDGCDHRCTYCSVWRARGDARSVPVATVLEAVRRAVDGGHRELVLTGVDLGSYGRGAGATLAAMVTSALDEVGGAARIRLSSINTNDITPALIELNGHPQLCSHWHMPLQSGSDAVLRAMHRGYRRAQYLRVCDRLRSIDPRTEFTTDIMVGFPGETDADHGQTLDLVAQTGMLAAHVFRWSGRPGTPAVSLSGQVPDAEARRRSAQVRGAAARSGRTRRLAAVGLRHDVVWDRANADTAHGITGTYIEVAAPAGAATQPGARSDVAAVSLDGEVLRATLVHQ